MMQITFKWDRDKTEIKAIRSIKPVFYWHSSFSLNDSGYVGLTGYPTPLLLLLLLFFCICGYD